MMGEYIYICSVCVCVCDYMRTKIRVARLWLSLILMWSGALRPSQWYMNQPYQSILDYFFFTSIYYMREREIGVDWWCLVHLVG